MADTQAHIFYSWQSDLPNATNRGFIQRALENAAKAVRDDGSLQVEPVVDRDTIGVPGSPDIAGTIFDKIERAQIFVCDVSIISESGAKRPTPNPNVLLELGYALKTLGPNRVLMVINDAFGGPEMLPFDLRMRRVIRYHSEADAQERAPERKQIEHTLAEGIRAILAGATTPPPGEEIKPNLASRVREAVELSRPNQTSLARTYMVELGKDLSALTLALHDVPQDKWDELLLESLTQSVGIVAEFTKTCLAISAMNAVETITTLFKSFEHVLDLYTLPNDFRGQFNVLDFDFAKFVGHEMLVTFIACLIQEERWDLIADLLARGFYTRAKNFERKQQVPLTFASEYLKLLELRKQRLQSNRLSLHADLLNERHTQVELGSLMPIEQFAEADYFLFLRAELPPETENRWIEWRPWSTLYLEEVPRYLVDAASARVAQQLLRPLGVPDIPTLKTRLAERGSRWVQMWGPLAFIHNPMAGFDTSTIGSQR